MGWCDNDCSLFSAESPQKSIPARKSRDAFGGRKKRKFFFFFKGVALLGRKKRRRYGRLSERSADRCHLRPKTGPSVANTVRPRAAAIEAFSLRVTGSRVGRALSNSDPPRGRMMACLNRAAAASRARLEKFSDQILGFLFYFSDSHWSRKAGEQKTALADDG